jgi:RNA polymerase sigma-70 factor (ECF subfamily)
VTPSLASVDHVDRDLVTALRRAEPASVDRLLTTYGSRAYRLAVRITGNRHDAEEVVQDALWSVVRKIDTFRAESAFGSWLYRIVVNAAYQKLRARSARRAEVSLDDALPSFREDHAHAELVIDGAARVEQAARDRELRVALASTIAELPATYRTTLILRDVEGLSIAEVAVALCITVANVKSRLHRARRFLRKRLAVYTFAAPPGRGTSRG